MTEGYLPTESGQKSPIPCRRRHKKCESGPPQSLLFAPDSTVLCLSTGIAQLIQPQDVSFRPHHVQPRQFQVKSGAAAFEASRGGHGKSPRSSHRYLKNDRRDCWREYEV